MKYPILSLIAFLALLSAGAGAQTPQGMVQIPSTNLSGTIAVTNTFQSIQAVSNVRGGCSIQNNGTHTMYIYFGAIANSTTGASATLIAGQSLNCLVGSNYVLKDQVSITGTSGDAFFANFQ